MSEIRADRIYSEDGSTGPSFPKAIPSLVISGIATASQINVGTGVTIDSNGINIGVSTFYGDASGLTNVPAGSSVTGDFTISSGNLVVGSGYGIDFSATSGTGTSELFDDYEEGTWTPIVGGTATYGARAGTYTKIGNRVMLTGRINISSIGTGSQNEITGLPFTASSITANYGGSRAFFTSLATSVVSLTPIVEPGTTSVFFYTLSAGATASSNKTNVKGNGTIIDFNITYTAA